jgi:hypothetical protein
VSSHHWAVARPKRDVLAVRLLSRVGRDPNCDKGANVVEMLLAIFMVPGAMIILLGMELLERRLLGSGSTASGGDLTHEGASHPVGVYSPRHPRPHPAATPK